jgi:hypothetical protein
MLQTLVNSFHEVGMENDFICFSDTEITNCIYKELNKDIRLSTSNYFFKLEYLNELTSFNYKYYVFLDADSFFVRKPQTNPSDLLLNNKPWFCFLESPINSLNTKRPDWWSVPNSVLELNFRKLGVISREIRNMNAGFWICQKEFIPTALNLAKSCFQLFSNQGFNITEEIPMSYIANYLYPDDTSLHLEKYTDYWCSDWIGNFKDKIPDDVKWIMVDYMTNKKFIVNPAIVHAMRSDSALINFI